MSHRMSPFSPFFSPDNTIGGNLNVIFGSGTGDTAPVTGNSVKGHTHVTT